MELMLVMREKNRRRESKDGGKEGRVTNKELLFLTFFVFF
jgi:hypothetical protein